MQRPLYPSLRNSSEEVESEEEPADSRSPGFRVAFRLFRWRHITFTCHLCTYNVFNPSDGDGYTNVYPCSISYPHPPYALT